MNIVKQLAYNFIVTPKRIGRIEFILREVFWLLVLFVALFSAFGVTLQFDETQGTNLTVWLYLPIFLLGAYGLLSAKIARFHDCNRTGWWVLLGAIPYVGVVISLYLSIQKGTAGANMHGAAAANFKTNLFGKRVKNTSVLTASI